MSFQISDNLVPKLKEQYPNLNFVQTGKVCDFCGMKLPMKHVSMQCSKCPTIFDRCQECEMFQSDWPSLPSKGSKESKNSNEKLGQICHKDHKLDNGILSQKDIDSFLQRDKKTIRKVYGESLSCRLRDDPRDSHAFRPRIDMTEDFLKRPNEFPQLNALIEQGGRIFVARSDDGAALITVDF